MLLAGDVGGTKTLLGLFTRAPHRPAPVAVQSFPTLEYDGLVTMIRAFLRAQPSGEPPIEAACFGVAGPVLRDRAWMTNVPWKVDGRAVALAFGLSSVRLLNDLVSIAHSVAVLQPEELHVLQAGDPNLAVRTVATRGVYVGGGIAPKNIPMLERPAFLASFIEKGPMKELLQTIPIKVIKNSQAGLLGAATVANTM